MCSNKKNLGQFYTTNVDKILGGFVVPSWVEHVIEPFAGNGDIIRWINKQITCKIDAFDIDPKYESTIKRDTLTDPPDYEDAYVITNPPYLSRNKCSDAKIKTIFDVNPGISDLFRIHIAQITDKCIGGILIIPLNFISASSRNIKDNDVRDKFLSRYKITALNLFEEQVFDDTTYTVIAIRFVWSESPIIKQTFTLKSFPSGKKLKFSIEKKYNWIIGGEIYSLPTSTDIQISRLVENTNYADEWQITKIFVHAIDGTTANNQIRLEYRTKPFYGKISDRAFATLIIKGASLSDEMQRTLIANFNDLLQKNRKKYNSLFLTNFRESKNGHGRKRITFEMVYQLISHLFRRDKSDKYRVIQSIC